MALVGKMLLYASFITTLYAMITAYMGVRRQRKLVRISRIATLTSALLVAAAACILLYALVTHNFQFAYVAEYTSRDLPLPYRISALWAGSAGSLLLWLLMISVLGVIPQYCPRYREKEGDLRISGLVNGVRLFFIYLLIAEVSPFATIYPIPQDGMGLHPMLQSFGMAVHPPLILLGYSGFLLPFAIAVTDLLARQSPEDWGENARPWVLFSWLLLSAGIVTGGSWAYTELGWGGYWAWDPVENASLLPWLTATALLHTLTLQRRQGRMKLWNFLLTACTFILTIFGTFLTRSGMLDSVHAFGDQRLGRCFLLFIFSLAALTLYAAVAGYPQLRGVKWNMRICAKEIGLLVTSLLLISIGAGVLMGTVFPWISLPVMGRAVTLDSSYYGYVTVPLWLGLVLLMGIRPLAKRKRQAGWRYGLPAPVLAGVITVFLLYGNGVRQGLALLSFGIAVFAVTAMVWEYLCDMWEYCRKCEGRWLMAMVRFFAQNRRRCGVFIVHIGVIVILVGVTGSLFREDAVRIVRPGDVLDRKPYRLAYNGMNSSIENGYTHVTAVLQVYEGNIRRGELGSEKIFHTRYPQPATEVGIMRNLRHDLYLTLLGWEGEAAYLQVSLLPLTSWIWLGADLLYLGAGIILWPRRRRQRIGQA